MVPRQLGSQNPPEQVGLRPGERQLHWLCPLSFPGAACDSGPGSSSAIPEVWPPQALGPEKPKTGKTPILLLNGVGVGHVCVPFSLSPAPLAVHSCPEARVDIGNGGATPQPASSAGGVRCLLTPNNLAEIPTSPLFLLQRQKPTQKFSERAHRWLWAHCSFFKKGHFFIYFIILSR